MKILKIAAAAGALAAASTIAAVAADISGAGATFPYPIYAKWADTYKKETGVGLNYQSIGSGGGIKQIQAKTVDFGASDMPLKPEDLDKGGLMQFPTVIGGVVPDRIKRDIEIVFHRECHVGPRLGRAPQHPHHVRGRGRQRGCGGDRQ